MDHSRLPAAVVVVAFASMLATSAIAQCGSWSTTGGIPGLNGPGRALQVRDPDGVGPLGPRLVVGGSFTAAGDLACNNLVEWDPATNSWSNLGTGTNGAVYALTTMPNGDLIAGGAFTTAGGAPANYLARWDGTSWSSVGGGMDWEVLALAVMPNGDLVAGGKFSTAGGVAAQRIARWNGAAWSPIGSGVAGPLPPTVHALLVRANGDLVVGGDFATAGGVPVYNIARWSGGSWLAMGPGATGPVRALRTMANGDVAVGGSFLMGGVSPPASNLARWTGSTWWQIGLGTNGAVHSLGASAAGDLLLGGVFTNAGAFVANGVASWNGNLFAGWNPSGPVAQVDALATLPGGDVIAAGEFSTVGGVAAWNVARWSGGAWHPLGRAFNGTVLSIATLPNGDFVVGGEFTHAGGARVDRVARWNGAAWSGLEQGMDGAVRVLHVAGNGDVVAGGDFNVAGGTPAAHVARWNGVAWTPIGTGLADPVYCITEDSTGLWTGTGNQFVDYRLRRWDGSQWNIVGIVGQQFPGSALRANFIRALGHLPNGDLVAGGNVLSGMGQSGIATWGGTWWSLITLGGTVHTITTVPGGVIMAGSFLYSGGGPANNIVLWDGSGWNTGWSTYGAGLDSYTYAVVVLPNGEVVAGGDFQNAGSVAASRLARWDGTSWSGFGSGADAPVRALGVTASGDLLVGGEFRTVAGMPTGYFARFDSCSSAYTVFGAGCAGALGVPGNEVLQQPKLGTSLMARITRMPQSLGFLALGTSRAVSAFGPLPVAMAPLGMAGCDLRVSLDYLQVLSGSNQTATWSLAIPNNPMLLGMQFYSQALVVDPAANAFGAILSDAATATLGQ